MRIPFRHVARRERERAAPPVKQGPGPEVSSHQGRTILLAALVSGVALRLWLATRNAGLTMDSPLYVHMAEALARELPDVDQKWEWRTARRSPLRVVLIGDSFVHRLSPFFHERFEHVKVFPVAAASQVDLAAVLAERPDLVIEEHVERYLMAW